MLECKTAPAIKNVKDICGKKHIVEYFLKIKKRVAMFHLIVK
jgi:hypothetical protein